MSAAIARIAALSRGPLLFVMCALVLAVAGHATAAQGRWAQPSIAFLHVNLVDIEHNRVLPDKTVVIRGDRIVSVGPSAQLRPPRDAKSIDARGKFAMPGLWDMHVHLSYATESALPLLLANGVTGVRDMGSDLAQIDTWRTEIADGVRPGPRIIRVGPILNGKSFNRYQMVVGNPDQARGAVRALKAAGVDFIKIHRRLSRDAYFALIDEAKTQGLRVIGHVPLEVTVEQASDAGQASVEHTETLFEGAVANGELLDLNGASIHKYLSAHGAAIFAKLVANHTVFTPTLGAWRVEIAARDGSLPDPNLRYVAASLRKAPLAPMDLPLAEVFGGFCDAVRQMHAAGVTLMAGTDTSVAPRVPGFLLHEELETLVACGLTPADALSAATLVPAAFLRRQDDFGAIATGKLADMLLLDANPLLDVRATRRPWAVVSAGRVRRRAELDGLLRDAERLADAN